MSPDKPILSRFHRALVKEIRRTRPEYLDHSFPVQEIYESLIPYRTHRNVIGVAMNGDYEDALLRLLGGEGDFLCLESEAALRQIRKELRSSNPNTGLFRTFATVGVRLSPQAVARVDDAFHEEGAPDEASAPDPGPVPASDLAPPAGGRDAVATGVTDAAGFEIDEVALENGDRSGGSPSSSAQPSEAVPNGSSVMDDAGADAGGVPEQRSGPPDPEAPAGAGGQPGKAAEVEESVAATAHSGPETDDAAAVPNAVASELAEPGRAESDTCRWCSRTLPDRDGVNYCPHCGGHCLKSCPACGEPLEASWRFCVACGVEVAAGGS